MVIVCVQVGRYLSKQVQIFLAKGHKIKFLAETEDRFFGVQERGLTVEILKVCVCVWEHMAACEHVPVQVASSTWTRCSAPTRLRSPSICSNLSANACSPRVSLDFDIAVAVDRVRLPLTA
jgi:hypothetical protein